MRKKQLVYNLLFGIILFLVSSLMPIRHQVGFLDKESVWQEKTRYGLPFSIKIVEKNQEIVIDCAGESKGTCLPKANTRNTYLPLNATLDLLIYELVAYLLTYFFVGRKERNANTRY